MDDLTRTTRPGPPQVRPTVYLAIGLIVALLASVTGCVVIP